MLIWRGEGAGWGQQYCESADWPLEWPLWCESTAATTKKRGYPMYKLNLQLSQSLVVR